MRLRTFTAADMPAAMRLVRDSLGEDAIILATEVHKSKKSVSVTAAIEREDDQPYNTKHESKPENRPESRHESALTRHATAEPLRFKLQETLRFHNMPELFIAKLMACATDKALTNLRKPSLQAALEMVLDSYFTFDPLSFEPGARIMLVGPPGAGKTLTIARMAAQLTLNKFPLTVITTDNKRAGGIEQLQAFTDVLNIDLHVAANKNELARHLSTVGTKSRVLIDTAGCNPYDAEELKALKSYIAHDIESVLTLPAGGDSFEAIDIVEAYMALPIKRLLITRADTARRFGGILAAAAAHQLTFSNVTGSSSITEPLRSLDAGLLARLLLQYLQSS